MEKAKMIVLRGVLDYPRIVGAPRKHTGLPQYDKGPYWSVDLTPNAEGLALLESLDLESKLRPKKKKEAEKIAADGNRVGKGKFVSFKILQNQLKDGQPTGETNKPPRIKTKDGKDWDGSLIGNGSVADCKVKVVDYGPGTEKGMYIQALRILEHVPYELDEFEPLSSDDEYFSKPDDAIAALPEGMEPCPVDDEDLDDDIPF